MLGSAIRRHLGGPRSWQRLLVRSAITSYYSLLRLLGRSRPSGSDWHRRAVGADWKTVGEYQFRILRENGLRPEHRLLDIGCGSFRGGVHFVDYLDEGNYFGIEKEAVLLETGRDRELRPCGLLEKRPHLFVIADFDLSSVGDDCSFDFMLAKSVFTHLDPGRIRLCLERVMPRLKPTGAFFATFLESHDSRIDLGIRHRWRKDERGQARYPLTFFEDLAKELGISLRYVGERPEHVDGKAVPWQQWLAFSTAP